MFFEYVLLVRKLGRAYFLEPAGEHGVWGLDDFHFLPFLFGASQLRNNPNLLPSGILNEATLLDQKDHFFYFSMIHHLKT